MNIFTPVNFVPNGSIFVKRAVGFCEHISMLEWAFRAEREMGFAPCNSSPTPPLNLCRYYFPPADGI